MKGIKISRRDGSEQHMHFCAVLRRPSLHYQGDSLSLNAHGISSPVAFSCVIYSSCIHKFGTRMLLLPCWTNFGDNIEPLVFPSERKRHKIIKMSAMSIDMICFSLLIPPVQLQYSAARHWGGEVLTTLVS